MVYLCVKYVESTCFACRIIQREAPRCSFFCDGHMPQPLTVGRVTDTDSHALFLCSNANEGRPAAIKDINMDFTLRTNLSHGRLGGNDLTFFYYDIGDYVLQGWPFCADWDSVVTEFEDQLDIQACQSSEIPQEMVQNQIRFTVCNKEDCDNGSKSAAFFRHLRNAFAHYNIICAGENYIITDGEAYTNMRGLVNVELLKNFCYRFFGIRDNIVSSDENHVQKLNL